MKKYYCIFLILIIFTAVPSLWAAQNTLFKGQIDVNGNISAKAGITTLESRPVFLAGGNWTALINHSLIIGNSWHITPFPAVYSGGKRLLSYGGPVLGWAFFPEKLFHFSGSCLIGTGQSWTAKDTSSNTLFFALEPELLLEMNISAHFHIALAGGYRFGFNSSSGKLGFATPVSGPVGNLYIRFGDF